MLSANALLELGEEMDGGDSDDDETSWTAAARASFTAAYESSKEGVERLLKLAGLSDSREVARVAILLGDVPRPWVAPARLLKGAEASVSYFGEPRVLVVVCLNDKDERAETATAQLMRLSNILREEKLTTAAEGEGPVPWVWPLHHKRTVLMLGAKVLVAGEDPIRKSCNWLGMLACPMCLSRCVGASGAGIRTNEIFDLVAKHYGGNISLPFAWTRYYAGSLWVFIAVLLPLAIPLGFLQQSDMMTVVLTRSTLGSAAHILSEMIKVVSVVWMLVVARSWPSPDLSGGAIEQDPLQVEGWAPRCYGETGSKLLAAACLLVVVAINFFIALLLFTFVFWLEMYLTFEWGDCIRLGCRDPAVKWGFLGWLVSITPGILEAILLALFTEVSLLCAEGLLWVRNARYLKNRMRFKFTALLALESLAKLGTFGILAMVFVPEWEDDQTLVGLPANFSNMTATEQRLARNSIDCSDLPDAALIGRGALLCVRRRLDVGYRRWLFQKAMTGPFCVAPFIAILIKVLLPILLQWWQRCFWRCERKERRTGEQQCCLKCWPTRFIIRAAGLIFANDGSRVKCFRFLTYGNPFQYAVAKEEEEDPEVERGESAEGAEAAAPEAASVSKGGDKDGPRARRRARDPDSMRPRLLRHALREAIEKVFEPQNVVLDNLLSIQWVGFFAVVWPWGCLPTLLAWVLQCRSQWALLLISKRRTFPEYPDAFEHASKTFVLIMAHLTVLWHVALSVVTYNSWLSTLGLGVVVGLLAGLWLAAVAVMWLLALAVIQACRRVIGCAGGDQDSSGGAAST